MQQNHPAPWCFLGDFNAILGSHEKRGGNLPSHVSCEEFNAWSDSCNLTHLLTRGAEYTWSNKRRGRALVEMRLDRSICNDPWLSFWDFVSCCTLPKSHSDHHPILLTLKKGIRSFPSSFKFHKMWTEHHDCKRLVLDVWNRSYTGCPMSILTQKLKL